MQEPRLEDMEDYNELQGEKKRIVWRVIIAGLFVGLLYVVASDMFSKVDDAIETDDKVHSMPATVYH